MRRTLSTVVGIVLSLGLVSEGALAQSSESATRAAARKLGYDGVEAFQAGQFAAAAEKLEKAYGVLRVPSLGIWSARALASQGKLVEATDRYLEVTRLPLGGGDLEVQKKAQLDAQAELDDLQAETPNLLVRVQGVEPESVSVKVDGSQLATQLVGEATPLNPGRHVVEGVSGSQRVTLEVTLARREHRQVTLEFAGGKGLSTGGTPLLSPSADSEAHSPDSGKVTTSPQGWAGWVALGGGVAGLAVGGVTGIMVLSKRSKLDEEPGCADDHSCPPAFTSRVDSLNTLRTVSTVGFVAGGVLAAAGVVLVLTAPKPRDAAQTAVWVSPSAVGLAGWF